MMNKVARYRGLSNGKAITKEPGYIYVTDDGLIIVDELRKEHVIPIMPSGGQDQEQGQDDGGQSDSISGILSRLRALEDKVADMLAQNAEAGDATDLANRIQMLEDRVDELGGN